MTAKCRRSRFPTSNPLRPPRPIAVRDECGSLSDTEAGTLYPR
jgi:hypothetical protein